jgi:hypothetical protein
MAGALLAVSFWLIYNRSEYKCTVAFYTEKALWIDLWLLIRFSGMNMFSGWV